jgi:hypothetical protein
MRISQKKHQQFQQQLFEYFSRKDNCIKTINNKMVATETDKGVSFTYLSDHSCIVHSYEFSLNTDIDTNTTIDAFIVLLASHNRVHYQPNPSYN